MQLLTWCLFFWALFTVFHPYKVGRDGASAMRSVAESLLRVPLVVVLLLRSTPVHALHVSSYQLLRGDAMPTAADRQLRRECEQALRSDSSSVDAQLGALAAHPLAVEMAHVGEQGRRVRRFWLPRGLSASVEELEVEAGCQVDTAAQRLRPTGSPEAPFSTGARIRLGAYPEPRLASANQPATAGEVSICTGGHRLLLQPPSLTVAASLTYGCRRAASGTACGRRASR